MSKKKIAGIIIACTIVIIVIVVIATHSPIFTPTQVNEYSKYGFSFEYPKTFSVTEVEITEGEGVSDYEGSVDFLWENGETELLGVVWGTLVPDQIEIWPGGVEAILMLVMEVAVGVIEIDPETVSFETGELVESTKAGHLMFYQYYAYTTTGGDKAYGVIGVFYCDEIQKLLTLANFNETTSVEEDGVENFQNYLDSFVCH